MAFRVSDSLNSVYDQIRTRTYDAVKTTEAGTLLAADVLADDTWARLSTGWASTLALHACVLGCAAALREIAIDASQIAAREQDGAESPEDEVARDWLYTALTTTEPDDLVDHIDQELMARGWPPDQNQISALITATINQARIANDTWRAGCTWAHLEDPNNRLC